MAADDLLRANAAPRPFGKSRRLKALRRAPLVLCQLGLLTLALHISVASAQDVWLSPTIPQTVGATGSVHVAPTQSLSWFDLHAQVSSDIISVDSVASEAVGCALQMTSQDLPGSVQQLDIHVECRSDYDPNATDEGLVRLDVTAQAAGLASLTVTGCAIGTQATCSPPPPLQMTVGP